MYNGEDLVKNHRTRANAIINILLLSFSVILARLWYLQIYKGKILLNYSLQNRLRREHLMAPRGMIFGRDQFLMVNNVPTFDAVITPQYLKNKAETLEKMAKILEMTVPQIQKIISKNSNMASYRPIIIKKNISWDEVAKIESENADLPGISVETFISREYPDKEIGAHLLGYISEISKEQLPRITNKNDLPYRLGDFIGQTGLEEEFDSYIRGQDGYEFVEVDALGRKKRNINSDIYKGIENRPSVPGLNLKLTVDRDLQKSLYEALEDKVGAGIAVDVRTGEILAMVSRPSFDPSHFGRGVSNDYWNSIITNENNPLRNRVVQEHYAPASTFKAIVALAGLEEGIIDEKTEITCNGKFRLGRRTFHCWKRWGHGTVDIYKSLRESCDVFYYKLATKLDIDVLAKYSMMLGLGQKSGIELPREIPGLIPTKEWKKKRTGEDWVLGETLSCAIGQSYTLTTPLQLAMAFATMANGGTLYRPYLVQEVFNNKGEVVKRYQPEVMAKLELKNPQNLRIVQKALNQVTNHPKGTAWWRRGRGIRMAGKTGTAQVLRLSADKLYRKCSETEYKYRHHGVFVSYAPFDDPSIAVAVVVEHGCGGSSAAAPVAEKLITTYMKKYRPQLYEKYFEEDVTRHKLFLNNLSQERALQKKKEEEKKVEEVSTTTNNLEKVSSPTL